MPPGLSRRLASLFYEGILLFGVMFITAYLFSALLQFKSASGSPLLVLFQFYMFAVIGLYFTWCWMHGGQTLPMKTWKLRIVADAGRLSTGRAWLRYTLAWIGPVAGVVIYKLMVELSGFGTGTYSVTALFAALPFVLLNWLWAKFDREGRFLHDRLAGTRIDTAPAATAGEPA